MTLHQGKRERCEECLTLQEDCLCSDPEFEPQKPWEKRGDFTRRLSGIRDRREEERAGLLRTCDRALARRLDELNENLKVSAVDVQQRLDNVSMASNRNTRAPTRIFDLLEDIRGSLESIHSSLEGLER